MITPEQLARTGTEHAEQAALFQWAAMHAYQNQSLAMLSLLFAVPNGDQRGDGTRKGAQIAGARLKAEGQRSGVPDIFLPVPRREKSKVPSNVMLCGLFIEMKRRSLWRDGDKLAGCSEEQKEWIAKLRVQGYRVEVCYGWEHARDIILDYLE